MQIWRNVWKDTGLERSLWQALHLGGAVFAVVHVDRSEECMTNELKSDSRSSTALKGKFYESLCILITSQNETSISLILAVYWNNTINQSKGFMWVHYYNDSCWTNVLSVLQCNHAYKWLRNAYYTNTRTFEVILLIMQCLFSKQSLMNMYTEPVLYKKY